VSALLAITMGDAAGIGPEIVVDLFGTGGAPQAFVIGDPGVMRRAVARSDFDLEIREIDRASDSRPGAGVLEVLATSELPADLRIGEVDGRAGAAAYATVNRAIDLALDGDVAGIVTAPINKAALHLAGAAHTDHTELLADRSQAAQHAMMLVGGGLRVVLVTTHLSLGEALRALTVERELSVIRLIDAELRHLGIAKPRIAVAGVNPHAGEGGLFGDEEFTTVAPAVEAGRAEGIDCTGPWPGDTVFYRALHGAFDAVVAQYHDQGLIPVKLLAFDSGVNVTLGLPFVRTSVDHGTAFDIAGRGIASSESLKAAFNLARDLVVARATSPKGSHV
jgi:4-hydroxythreonine-4-phosphate dehydrogenase